MKNLFGSLMDTLKDVRKSAPALITEVSIGNPEVNAIVNDELLISLWEYLRQEIPGEPAIYIVGGALRDPLVSAHLKPKDIDIVVNDTKTGILSSLPNSKVNFFGGVTFTFRDTGVDVWPLRETYHIRNFGLSPTISSFLLGAPFNLDKIAFDISSQTLYDGGCKEGVRDSTISYFPLFPYLEHIQAVRLMLLREKTGFDLHMSSYALLYRAACLLDNPANLEESRSYLAEYISPPQTESVLGRLKELAQAISTS